MSVKEWTIQDRQDSYDAFAVIWIARSREEIEVFRHHHEAQEQVRHIESRGWSGRLVKGVVSICNVHTFTEDLEELSLFDA